MGIFIYYFVIPAFSLCAESHPALDTDQTKKKGKAIPLQAWTGSEGSRRIRLPDFKTVNT